ncbi:hypothetical protein DVH24_042604 [Malus domestica]|uniref:Uncharacterized protein n=1 Tax=Malus domestica TaxID=3750 RepID=A0A498KPQ5_MALDO|nr:hypothetical protein DVH24_042604 [Malus domestica]
MCSDGEQLKLGQRELLERQKGCLILFSLIQDPPLLFNAVAELEFTWFKGLDSPTALTAHDFLLWKDVDDIMRVPCFAGNSWSQFEKNVNSSASLLLELMPTKPKMRISPISSSLMKEIPLNEALLMFNSDLDASKCEARARERVEV